MVDNDEMVINVMVEASPTSITQITFFKSNDLTQYAKLFSQMVKFAQLARDVQLHY